MMTFFYKVFAYIRTGYLLHLVTLAELIILSQLYSWLNIDQWLHEGPFLIKIVWLLPFLSFPIFPQLDALSRYQNYKMIRDHFYTYGFQPRIVKPFIKSRCQRDAVIAAAEELGLDAACKKHFYEMGYRWNHLLPDFVFTKPTYLSKKIFWTTTFFARRYTAKTTLNMIRRYRLENRAKKIMLNVH